MVTPDAGGAAGLAAGLTPGDIQGFTHVRIIIGLVTGLSVTRILTGLARFVQHPREHEVHAPHLIWSTFLLLYVFHFWWLEFGLVAVQRWRFEDFLFVVCYAALIFFTATLLYPDRMEGGAAAYFQDRRLWFYGFLVAFLLVDIADTALKGADHVRMLGAEYALRQGVLIAIALAGMRVVHPTAHAGLATAATVTEMAFILSRTRFLD